jgi:hypothetical protein
MTDIFCRLNDDLKLEVLSFFSAYDCVSEELYDTQQIHEISKGYTLTKLDGECKKTHSIKNIAGQTICSTTNLCYIVPDWYRVIENEYDTIIDIDEDNVDNGEFEIIHKYKNYENYIFYFKYIKNSYYHSNMWQISTGYENLPTIFVNVDDLIDILEWLDVDENEIKKTLEKYKK